MVVSPKGVKDLAVLIQCDHYVWTSTELWDVTLSLKIKKAVFSLLTRVEGLSETLGFSNNEFCKRNCYV